MAKLAGKRAELEKQIEKLSEKVSGSDYREKVPTKVQEQDAEKVGRPRGGGEDRGTGPRTTTRSSGFASASQLRQSQTELEKVKEATDNFRKLM